MRFSSLAAVAGVCAVSLHGANASGGPAAGRIVATGSMSVARHSAAAVALRDGTVLIAGGMPRNGVFLSSAELYDPAIGRFRPTASMKSMRGYGAAAARLPDGNAVVAGGRAESSCTNTAEVYDAARGTFAPAGNMHVARCGAFALVLPSGNVLFVGGDADGVDAAARTSVERYDAATGKFALAGVTPQAANAAVLLRDGRVLVVHETDADLYDPATARFTRAGRLRTARHKIGAALLPDGRVMIFGGQIGDAWGANVDSTEIFDPRTGTFGPGPDMREKRFKLRDAVVTLPDGRVLVGGGAARPEVYDARSHAFAPAAGEALDGFYFSSAVPLRRGDVLLAGGYGSDYEARAGARLFTP